MCILTSATGCLKGCVAWFWDFSTTLPQERQISRTGTASTDHGFAAIGTDSVMQLNRDVNDVPRAEFVRDAVGQIIDTAAALEDHNCVLGALVSVRGVLLARLHSDVVHRRCPCADAWPGDHARIRRDDRQHECRPVTVQDLDRPPLGCPSVMIASFVCESMRLIQSWISRTWATKQL